MREREIRETIGVRFLELLRNRFKNPPFLLSRDLYMLKGHIPFASCFMNDREPRGETFPKCGAGLNYCLILARPLIF